MADVMATAVIAVGLWELLWTVVAVLRARESREARTAKLAEATADARARLAAIDARLEAELEAIRREAPNEPPASEATQGWEAREAIDAWLQESWVARVLAAREAFRRKPPRGGLDDLWTCRANERPPTPAAIEWVERRLAEQARFEDVST